MTHVTLWWERAPIVVWVRFEDRWVSLSRFLTLPPRPTSVPG